MKLLRKLDLTTKKYNELEKRIASRGIVVKEDKVLMIYIEKDNTYSFPGGGVEFGETFEETCIREMKEEAGAQGIKILSEFGYVDEFRDSKFSEDKAFNMISYYYLCEISDTNGSINLEEYEKELGFKAVWINVTDALKHNKSMIVNNEFTKREIRYLYRSIIVLEELERRL